MKLTRPLSVVLAALTAAMVFPMQTSVAQDPRSVMLAIDASGSMAGERIVQARNAGVAFVDALPPDVAVGVIAFADSARVLLEPTTDRSAADAAIGGIRADGDTALTDGVVAALDQGVDRVIVLSDGEDTASSTPMPALLEMTATAAVPIDVVALKSTAEHAAVLKGLAEGSGGTYVSAADVSALASAFRSVAEVVVAASSPGPTPTADAVTRVQQSPAAVAAPVQRSLLLPLVLAVTVMIAVGLFVVGSASVIVDIRHRRSVQSALHAYAAPRGAQVSVDAGNRLAQILHDRFRDSGWYARLAGRLDLAGIEMRPALWIAVSVGSAIAAGVLLAALTNAAVLGLLIGLLTFGGFSLIVSSRGSKAIRDFDTELPDFLLLVASGMRSGLSFAQSVDAAAAEGAGQVARQMTRVVAEARLGAPVEEALMHAADRMQSEDLRWTVTALAMQRQIGGNLSTILETAAMAVRGRAELRREVRTLSAEGRLSAYVLIALPISVFVFMGLTRTEYIDFFWTEPAGVMSLAALGLLVGVGALWIRSIVRIEV